ncbi:flagellar hook-associated protein FlgK [Paraliobacillus salinarum]|uniref:flagellar hook-associated protein FlgK n=1 Tax=Paraliobacillus salinarum TaxID=1158996 RepID=UPI0015F4484D|nr:flagellar hook-associated protein FlgK [Paraliobacillus salinarum]
MVSTFHGLEVAMRALNSQQTALYTTSHNISNANTEGYTRQRVNFEQVSTLTGSRYTEGVKSNIGSGVQAGSIQRVRDSFLDVQFRNEHGKVGYYNQRAAALKQMEDLMNEPSEEGLNAVMDQFYGSLQDLADHPEDSGTRSVVTQRGLALADTFNYLNSSLQKVRGDLKNQLDVTTKDINSILTQINDVNDEIKGIEPHGHVPNDLYDERDRLIDQLSSIANISVTYDKSSGQPSPIAEGVATITLNGVGQDVTLVDGKTGTVNHLEIIYDGDDNVETFSFFNPDDAAASTIDIAAADFDSQGELKGLMEMNGYIGEDVDGDGNGDVTGYYNEMISDIDDMAKAFADAFNTAHQNGIDLNGDSGLAFFEYDPDSPAGSITVNQGIIDDPDLIAASINGDAGDGSNATNLSDVLNQKDIGLGENKSTRGFYQSLIGDMGVKTQEANRMLSNAAVLQQQVQENRASVSAVSLDEEMTNLIRFQHAYNAAARGMTAVDEMLDRIINNMGLVGR